MPKTVNLSDQTSKIVAGVDEAGRGPLAGPVIAAAVILDPARPVNGLADSKKLSEKRREKLAVEIKQYALAWQIGRAEVGEIDAINILQASLLAMQRAVQGLTLKPQLALIDGNRCPALECDTRAIIKGDATEAAISAASILAKVTRDHEMVELDEQYPGYGFASHKGYPSKQHLQALQELGICPEHRCTYAPVRRVLEQDAD